MYSIGSKTKCGKGRKCLLPAFLLFAQCCQKLSVQDHENSALFGKGQRQDVAVGSVANPFCDCDIKCQLFMLFNYPLHVGAVLNTV